MYTLKELYDNLDIPISALGRKGNINEGTVSRIRDGYPARRSTMVRLLRAFSEVYSRPITFDNVSGIQIEDKHIVKRVEQKPSPSVNTPTINAVSQTEVSQNQPTIAKKRTWNQPPKKADYFPDGAIGIADFAKAHSVPYSTLYGHMLTGLGGGLIGTHTNTIPQNETIAYTERVKPSRPKEKERYLTSDQQRAALEFWKRHDVAFTECDQAGCSCHNKGE